MGQAVKKLGLLLILTLAVTTPMAWAAEQQSSDFYTQVSLGLIPGYSTCYVYGNNAAVGATRETIWPRGGFIAIQSSATVVKISSGDADDAAGDTGARTLFVGGLDANYLEINETVTMNGQTAVNTTKSYLRVLDLEVLTAGSSGWNEGIIYAGVGAVILGVPATVYNVIEATVGHDLTCFTTVPAGHTGLVMSYYYTSGTTKDVIFMVMMRSPGGSAWIGRDRINMYQAEHWATMNPPYTVPEKWDIMLTAEAAVSTTASGGFVIMFVEDSVVSAGVTSETAMDPMGFILLVAVVFVALGAVALWRRR